MHYFTDSKAKKKLLVSSFPTNIAFSVDCLSLSIYIISRENSPKDILNLNKANLRDLIAAAATGLVILLNLDSNCRFFSLCDLEIWRMTSKYNRATLLYFTKLCVHHFKSICELKLELQSGNTQFWSKSAIFCPLWPWNSMDDLN